MDTFKRILDDVDEVDLTPMIDVTFLLLIYFMVTTMLKQRAPRHRVAKVSNFRTKARATDSIPRATYAKVLGSAVNPVLREGNSDRRGGKNDRLQRNDGRICRPFRS